MASLVTIAEIKTRARRKADMEASLFVGDAELLDMVNAAYAELYDLLVQAFENYYVASATVALNGSSSYPLPADFYKILKIYFTSSNGVYTRLDPYDSGEEEGTLARVPSTGTVTIRYVPAPVRFVADTDTLDGRAGWEELLVTDVAIMMLEKEESNTEALEARRQRIYRRVQEMAQSRSLATSGRIRDVYRDSVPTGEELRYRLMGDAIEIINCQFLGV